MRLLPILLFLLIVTATSCKKNRFKTGVFEFHAYSLTYSHDGSPYSLSDIGPREVVLEDASDHLLTFDEDGSKNYLAIADDDSVAGVWTMDALVPGTSKKTGYNLNGFLIRKKMKWTIEGLVTFKSYHEGLPVDASGNFTIKPLK